jgi:hypothetical protein
MPTTPPAPLHGDNLHDEGDPTGMPMETPPAGRFRPGIEPTAAPEVPAVELEPGWSASRALMRVSSDALLALMLRPSFRPVKDLDLVPVARCPHCLDGGLRTAGTVRTRRGREPVRACDTCARIEVGDLPPVPH